MIMACPKKGFEAGPAIPQDFSSFFVVVDSEREVVYCNSEVFFMNKPVYLFFGDSFRADKAGKSKVSELVPGDQAMLQVDEIEASAANSGEALEVLDRCREALGTVGFFGGGRVVWLRGADFLVDNAVGKTKAVKERVGELADLVKSGQTGDSKLVVTAPKVDKRQSFYKACNAAGEVVEYQAAEKTAAGRKEALKIAGETANANGMRLSRNVLEGFVDRVGYDSRQITCEMEKLAVFLAGRKNAGWEEMLAVVSASNEALTWDLADAFGSRNMKKALQVVRQLIFQKISPVGLVIALERRIKDLTVIREAMSRGWLEKRGRDYAWSGVPEQYDRMFADDFEKDPRKMHPYRLKILVSQAARYKVKELDECRNAVEECHTKMVTSSLPQDVMLELLLVRMISTKPANPHISQNSCSERG
jgi:DNA polymerase-3 subunit delta